MNFNIIMPRGDIRPVRFTVRSPDTQEVVSDLDEVYFTVKRNYTDRDFLFQKRLTNGDIEKLQDDSYQFSIMPGDTDGLKIGKYVFDIELVRGNDLKQTFAGDFVLTNEVTFAENEG